MNVVFLLDDTSISARARTVLAYSDELTTRGYTVRIVTADAPLRWRPSRAHWLYVDDVRAYDAAHDDLLVVTSAQTAATAAGRWATPAVHLCFGDEPAAAYRLPIPKLVVARSLVEICRQFSDDVTYIGQIVDEELYRARTPPENDPPRVLLSGHSQADLKGIADGYGAVTHARWFHQKVDLVRVSPWEPSREEALETVQEFHVALTTREMRRLMHSCDLLIAPNYREDGFGLPAAEALASGIPAVLTAVPSYLSFDDRHDFALFAPERNGVELGERLIELLSDASLRERLRARGREVAEQWRAHHAAERLERFFIARRAGS